MHYLLFMYLGRFICLFVVFSCICVYQCGVINCSKPMHCVLSEFRKMCSEILKNILSKVQRKEPDI